MDTEKMIEVEMKEFANIQDNEEAEKNKTEATKEEEGANVYCRLNNPTEETHWLRAKPASAPKLTEDVCKKVRVYKRISAVFIILSVLLLAGVLALAIKLHEVQSFQKHPQCTVVEELNCSRDLCQAMYPLTQHQEYQCSECQKGWMKFINSCYFISNERLSWQQSREDCQKRGGDLLIISTEHVQRFLSKNFHMLYWIGLHYSEEQQWMWVNNTAPVQSYWSIGQPNPDQGSCALLNGGTHQNNNWLSNSCQMISQYICQKS